MPRHLRLAVAPAALFVLAVGLAACGGSGGGGGGGEIPAGFLTADPRGFTNGGAGAPLGTAAPGADAAEAAVDVAREIEEADLYRVDGDLLYLLNAHRGLAVVDLDGMAVLGRLALGGFPHEMYVRDGRALALLSAFDGTASLVDVSVADPSAPSETARLPLGGSYRASRLVGSVLYVVTDGEVRSFAVGASVAPVDVDALPHSASFVHATDALLAVAGWGSGLSTPVALVDVSDPAGSIDVRGALDLPGWLADEFKMHVAGTVLRVVTHDWASGGLSHLTTVDVSDLDLPTVMGTLDLARGEQLFATRFSDDAAFIVTFEQVDPLWVVDLRDPHSPSVTGSLVVDGWSTHLVPTGDGRLVAIGVDPADGWRTIASLFDVSDPANPALRDRADLGTGWSSAFGDPKGLGVFPGDGLVFVPFSGETDQLVVLDLGATTLDVRGGVGMEGVVLRGFPHPLGLVGISTEEVVLVDPATLGELGRATIAENAVDACRLPDGTLLPLVARRDAGRLGDLVLPLVPERLHPYGFRVAVTGWDGAGRAAYVVDYSGPAPVVSARFDLGGSWFVLGDPSWGVARPEGGALWWGGGFGASDAVLTDDGHLVVHGVPGLSWSGGPMPLGLGEGAPAGDPSSGDGFIVIDVANSELEAPIEVEGGGVTGFVADGDDLVYTVGSSGGADDEGRPLVVHSLVRVDLATRAESEPRSVPGYVVSAEGDLLFAAQETWTEGWSWECAIVAFDFAPAGEVQVADTLVLPEMAYDLRAAGATLWFTRTTYAFDPGDPALPGGGGGGVAWAEPGMDFLPTTSIGTIRLGADLSFGPSVEDDAHFLTLLLPEDGSALLVRDGVTVERWDVSGLGASLLWSSDVGVYPYAARPDPASAGSYLLVLGYAGVTTVP
jgi:hypothetical protein